MLAQPLARELLKVISKGYLVIRFDSLSKSCQTEILAGMLASHIVIKVVHRSNFSFWVNLLNLQFSFDYVRPGLVLI